MTKLESLVKSYKETRAARNTSMDNIPERDQKSNDLTYWSEQITKEMKMTNTPIETVRAMINN